LFDFARFAYSGEIFLSFAARVMRMYKKSVRLMNDAERTKIQGWLNPAPTPENQSLWSRLVCYFSGEAGFRAHIENARQRSAPKYREMLEDNHVEVHSLKPYGVVELQEEEGESYFFDIGGGQIFCLRLLQGGPVNDSERSRWPNTDFEIVRSRRHPFKFQQIWCHGTKLEPTRYIEQSSHLWNHFPDTDVFHGTLVTIECDLESLGERQSN
jgi:hypothetical protein